MRKTARFAVSDPALSDRLLDWVSRASFGALLDSNDRTEGYSLMAFYGAEEQVRCRAGEAFDALRRQIGKTPDWYFGYLGYDLKNETEGLSSDNHDGIGMPDLFFIRPESVVLYRSGSLEIHSLRRDPYAVWEEIRAAGPGLAPAPGGAVVLTPRLAKADYCRLVDRVRDHIVEGDVYELNLCQEFYQEQAMVDPVGVFRRLKAISRAPFSVFARWEDTWLLCASPERFLKKEGSTLVSQPIKGTRRRGAGDAEDRAIREGLARSEKDRAENVMIVDLVRNDLARNCLPGSVVVEELFGIYTFPTVHQMISTVRGTLRVDTDFISAIRDAFPMGSMTGAPKVRAMELIEELERTRRGVFSGAAGYFTPWGDFDLNVVIRSILYSASSGYLSLQVGGAIVYDSDPEAEYQECLVKADALFRALEAEIRAF